MRSRPFTQQQQPLQQHSPNDRERNKNLIWCACPNPNERVHTRLRNLFLICPRRWHANECNFSIRKHTHVDLNEFSHQHHHLYHALIFHSSLWLSTKNQIQFKRHQAGVTQTKNAFLSLFNWKKLLSKCSKLNIKYFFFTLSFASSS